jgi:C4-dicarboxylate transporter DctM subunit
MIWVSVAILVVLAVLGVPLFLACLAAVSFAVFVVMDVDATFMMQNMFLSSKSFVLIAVPLFILSGQILAASGAVQPLIRLFNAFLGRIPGGPAYALILGCMLFGAMSSSALAAVAGFGPVMIPLLVQLGYSRMFAVGLLLCASTLAQLIPPSIQLIFYGYIAQESIVDLWTAGIVPGIIVAIFLGVTVLVHTRRGHYETMPTVGWGERWQAAKESWPVLLMVPVVLAPIYAGIATPTEVSAIAVAYSLFLGFVWYRGLTKRAFWDACLMTARMTGIIFVIILVFLLLNVVLTHERIPFQLGEMMTDLGGGWMVFMLVATVAFLLMGSILDPSAMMFVAVPILLPTLAVLGISKVSFGVFTTFATNLAIITPPYGLLLFAAMPLLNLPFTFVARACLMFYPALILGMLLVAYFPQLSTWLPDLIR